MKKKHEIKLFLKHCLGLQEITKTKSSEWKKMELVELTLYLAGVASLKSFAISVQEISIEMF